MYEFLQVGKIVNTHGINGEVKVMPLTNDPERYETLDWVYLERDNVREKLTIEGVKYFKNFVIVKFKEVKDMNEAGKLKNLFLLVDREHAVKLREDEFFICDLIESNIFDENGKKLGVLKDVFSTGSNDVYVVRNENSKDILIPALKSVVREVSLKDKKIVVALPEGLVEDEV